MEVGNTGDMLKSRLSDGIIIIASNYNGKVNTVAAATKDAVKGIHSGNIIKRLQKLPVEGRRSAGWHRQVAKTRQRLTGIATCNRMIKSKFVNLA